MKGPFEAIKKSLVGATTGGGVLATGSDAFMKATQMLEVAGSRLGQATAWGAEKLIEATTYAVDNWVVIATKIRQAFDVGLTVAKMMVAGKILAAGGSTVAGAGSSLFKLGQDLAKSGPRIADQVMKVANAIGGIGTAAAVALPVLALMSFAFLGVAAVLTSFVAYWIDNWTILLDALRSGTVTLEPLFIAIEQLWAKLVALGASLFSTGAVATNAQGIIDLLSQSIWYLMGGISVGLRILGAFQLLWNGLTAGLRVVSLGFATLVSGILMMVKAAASAIPGMESFASGIGSALADINKERMGTFANIKEDTVDATRLFKAADAFDLAFAEQGKGIAAGLRKALEKGLITGPEGATGNRHMSKGTQVHIHNMKVVNDLRNEDPDRIAGAFVKKLVEVTEHQTQALTLHDYGQ
jgi:hypothetical protein